MKIRVRVLKELGAWAALLFLKSSFTANTTHCQHQRPQCQAFATANRPSFGRSEGCKISFFFSFHCSLPLAPPNPALQEAGAKQESESISFEGKGGLSDRMHSLWQEHPLKGEDPDLPKPIREMVSQDGGPPAGCCLKDRHAQDRTESEYCTSTSK